jgi:hypothetical protein
MLLITVVYSHFLIMTFCCCPCLSLRQKSEAKSWNQKLVPQKTCQLKMSTDQSHQLGLIASPKNFVERTRELQGRSQVWLWRLAVSNEI